MKAQSPIRIDDITPIDGRLWPSEQAWKNFEAVYRPIVMKEQSRKEIHSHPVSATP